MNKVKLKICGMKYVENINEMSSLDLDFMGFIYYKKSPRYVGENFKLPAEFPKHIIPIGVFVNEETSEILRKTALAGIKMIQLHGDESPEQCEELKKSGCVVVKVFSVDDDFDFSITTRYKKAVDFFLFDTKGKYYGGNAQRFSWEILQNYDQEIPFFLSGGLSPDNISDIENLENMNIYAVDVNSGVEALPGVKDKAKVLFIQDKLKELVN